MFSAPSIHAVDKNTALLQEACRKSDFKKIEELIKLGCTLNFATENQSPYYYLLLESEERMFTYDSSSNRQKAFLALWRAGARLKNSTQLLHQLHRIESKILIKFVLDNLDEFGWDLSKDDMSYFLCYPANTNQPVENNYIPSQKSLKTLARALPHDPDKQFELLSLIENKDLLETLLYYLHIANRLKSLAAYSIESNIIKDLPTFQLYTDELKQFLAQEKDVLNYLKEKNLDKVIFACRQILLDAEICLDTSKFNYNQVIDHDLDILGLHLEYLQHLQSIANKKPNNKASDDIAFVFESPPKFNRSFKLVSYASSNVKNNPFAYSFFETAYKALNDNNLSSKEMMEVFFKTYGALTHPANWQQTSYLLKPLQHLMQYLLTLDKLKQDYTYQEKLANYPAHGAWADIFANENWLDLFKEKLAELEKYVKANEKLSIAASSKIAPFVYMAGQLEKTSAKLAEQAATIEELRNCIKQLEASFLPLKNRSPSTSEIIITVHEDGDEDEDSKSKVSYSGNSNR